MIYFINARNIPPEAKEVWFCVRSLQIYKKQPGVKYKHVSVLSPNLDLFLWARKKIDHYEWDNAAFTKYYNEFTKQITNDTTAMNIISYLRGISNDKEHDIYLACYCVNFERCHLNILKDIINNA